MRTKVWQEVMASLLKDSGGLSNVSYLQEAVTQQTESSLNNSWGACILMGQTLLGSFYHISFKNLTAMKPLKVNFSTVVPTWLSPFNLHSYSWFGIWDVERLRGKEAWVRGREGAERAWNHARKEACGSTLPVFLRMPVDCLLTRRSWGPWEPGYRATHLAHL